MDFIFNKNLEYQNNVVEDTVSVFANMPTVHIQKQDNPEFPYKNDDLDLDRTTILGNIQTIQEKNGLPISRTLIGEKGIHLDISMETGTGKTFVYIKTIVSLYEKYHWGKFVVVVPSIAIREGALQSFNSLSKLYDTKINFFEYRSDKLEKIIEYSSNTGIQVMIINYQSFVGDNARIYNDEDQEKLQGYSAKEWIANNQPIVIIDEPQKMEGKASLQGLEDMNGIIYLYYSATHKTQHNLIFNLDSIDAFRHKLVKKIEVVSQEKDYEKIPYIYVREICEKKGKISAKLVIEKVNNNTIEKVNITCKKEENLSEKLYKSSKLDIYKTLKITDLGKDYIKINNQGEEKTLHSGDSFDDTEIEEFQKIQIANTIKLHFEKEQSLFEKGIKTLSLFFIDRVHNFKYYDDSNVEQKGKYWRWFEEEYDKQLEEILNNTEISEDYKEYLERHKDASPLKAYFAEDKKHVYDDPSEKNELSAYQLILGDKRLLLDMESPVRFIFSHSALSEGWDNPNVFQICTLRHTSSEIRRRQEIGRGLRICVNKDGVRIDDSFCKNNNEDFFNINKLSVITNETYTSFVEGYQSEVSNSLSKNRVTIDKLIGCKIDFHNGAHTLTEPDAIKIVSHLLINKNIGETFEIKPSYFQDKDTKLILDFVQEDSDEIHNYLRNSYNSETVGNYITENGKEIKNTLNENSWEKIKDFWEKITKKQYMYKVNYDSENLISNSIKEINNNLEIHKPKYTISISQMKSDGDFHTTFNDHEVTFGDEYKKFDFVDLISKKCTLKRSTVAKILNTINKEKQELRKDNPTSFIEKVSIIILHEKQKLMVTGIIYDIQDSDKDIHILETCKSDIGVNEYDKSGTKYTFTDSEGEIKFASSLQENNDVTAFIKIPRTFYIPTPVGNYSPDWLVVYKDKNYKIIETKGSEDTNQLRTVESIKIECAKKAFGKNYELVAP